MGDDDYPTIFLVGSRLMVEEDGEGTRFSKSSYHDQDSDHITTIKWEDPILELIKDPYDDHLLTKHS